MQTTLVSLQDQAAIGLLPDDVDMHEIMYQLYVLDKIRKGQEAVEQGKTITSEESYSAHMTSSPRQPLFCRWLR